MEWLFDEEMLHALNFPQRLIRWIMACIISTQYIIAVNGGIFGIIKGKCGLRQGDLISPLLFIICMEYLYRIMKWITNQRGFQYHIKCKGIKLNHLCFADDVMFFCKGKLKSVELILSRLKTFSQES